MKIRIISDIHCDINKNKKFNYGEDFVICCGDISGDRFTSENWIKNNIKQGIFVGGNHLGYNIVSNDKKDSLNLSIKYLQDKFSEEPIYFLENQYIIKNDIVFIGCILFTDFDLFPSRCLAQEVARQSLNDYRRVKIYKHCLLQTLLPDDTLKAHRKSKRYINKICKDFSDKKVIVITHHAPSILSVQTKYKNDILSAAFASNLENLMEKNKNIKLWCHGHVHNNADYKIFDTRIVANPLGYYDENPDFINEGLLIDTDTL
jgi:Icc-related predicted phosphoesterase